MTFRYSAVVDNKKEDDQKHLTMKLIWNQLFNKNLTRPNRLSSLIVTVEVCIFCKDYYNCLYEL